jgi:hypothetical protein
MFNIKIPCKNRSSYGTYWVGDRQRLATATAVQFLDDDHIVAAHLVGAALFLIKIDWTAKQSVVIDSIDTTLGTKLEFPDLMDLDNDCRISCSHFAPGAQSIYSINNYKFSKLGDIPNLNNFRQSCHGVRFFPDNKDIIAVTGNSVPVVNFISIATKKIIFKIEYDIQFVPKDMFFITAEKLIIIYTTSKVLSSARHASNYVSRLLLINLNLINKSFNILDTIDIAQSHADGITYTDNVVYMANQIKDQVIAIKIQHDKFYNYLIIEGFNFPHGISVRKIKDKVILAVTNYGDSTIKFVDVTEA